MKKNTVINHLQIIHTWATFALERDRNFFNAAHMQSIAEWTEDAITMMKEQETVKPIIEHKLFLCPVCKNTLFREQKFCHECGKRIEWEGR